MTEKLIDIIKQLQQENPKLLEGLEQAAAAGLKADKIAAYDIFVKENNKYTYEALDKILERHENSRIDINWNKADYIYRIVISRRKRQPEKERKPRSVKITETMKGGENNNGNNQSNTETKGANDQ